MKRWLKAPFRILWRATFPLRRPILARLASFIQRSTWQPPHHQHHHLHCHVTEETGLLMDHMVRQLVLLQRQVDQLEMAIEEMSPAMGGLAVVGMDADERSAAG